MAIADSSQRYRTMLLKDCAGSALKCDKIASIINTMAMVMPYGVLLHDQWRQKR